jgi:STE24 endopeptidase
VTPLIKSLVIIVVAALTLIAVATFTPYPPAYEAALEAGFTTEQIDIGLQYAFERRIFFWVGTALELGLLYYLALTGWARRWADLFLGMTGQRRLPAALGMGLVYFVLHLALFLPLGIARFYHSQYWGMSNHTWLSWLQEYALYTGITLVFEAIILVMFYAFLILLPRFWWLIAPLGLSTLAIAYAYLSPILINPLFNEFTPLSQTEWREQQPRVRKLIDKAGIPVEEILVMDASLQSNHTNAYFTGFGSTRRIVLYDTLLKNHTPDEIESVLAHEIGHWQHDHIVKGIILGTIAALFGLLLLHLILRGAMDRAPWHLTSIADPAGLPLILLLLNLGSWLAMPVENALIRYFERQADHASLELAGQPDAFIACERKMAIVNKMNVAPSPWSVWLFSTHPPTVERICTAQEWKEHMPD